MPQENDSAWLEGFISECDELGLPKEGAEVLLKTAAQLSMCEDENFSAGFKAEMEKEGGVMSSVLRSPAWAAGPASILSFLGLQGLMDAFRRNWRRSPEESSMLSQMGDSIGHPDPSRLVEQMDLARRGVHRARTPVGGSYQDPLLGGDYRDDY